MNQDEILAQLPPDEEYQAAPNYEKQRTLVRLIHLILDQIEAEGREPDVWEADHISRAVGFILTDWYNGVLTLAILAMTPPEKRAHPEKWVRAADTPDTRALRDGLEYAAGKPAPRDSHVRNG